MLVTASFCPRVRTMDLSIVYLKKRKAFGRAAALLVTTEPELLGEFEANEALIASYPERTRVLLNVQAIPERSEHWVGACRPACMWLARLCGTGSLSKALLVSARHCVWPSCVAWLHTASSELLVANPWRLCALSRPRTRGIPEPRHEPHGGWLAQGRRPHREGPDRTLPQEGTASLQPPCHFLSPS